MPKIGLRNIKTAIAVSICLLLNIILVLASDLFPAFLSAPGKTFAQTWFSPFFAGIAAAFSVQSKTEKSVDQAKIRSIGSIIGGLFGLVIVLVFEAITLADLTTANPLELGLLYLFVALGMIPLIHLTVVTKQTAATFVTCLTYLSITVSVRNNLPVTYFAFNRIFSTIFGVMMALLVNKINFHFIRNKEFLFVCGLDGTLLQKDKKLTNFTKFKMNHLILDGANITIATTRTPASLNYILEGLKFNLPLMIMNGSVVFDTKIHHYSNIKNISESAKKGINQIIDNNNLNAFIYTIIDGVLTIYHNEFKNQAEERFYFDRKNDFFRNHVKGAPYEEQGIVFYIFLNEKAKIIELEKTIMEKTWATSIKTNAYPYEAMEGYYFLKVNSIEASKEHAVNDFKKDKNFTKVIALGGKSFDIPMMNAADYAICLESAEDEVKKVADKIIKGDNPDLLMREISKLYYRKNQLLRGVIDVND